MEHHLVNKVSRCFPSSFTSCQLSSVPDVVESSIPITKSNTKTFPHALRPPKPISNVARNNSSSMIKPGHDPKTLYKNDTKGSRYYNKSLPAVGSDAEGRKCPPVTPALSVTPAQKIKKVKETTRNNVKSTSSNSGRWFSSTDDEEAGFDGKSDAFFSLSSCSSDSFRRKRAQSTSTSWRRYDNTFFNDLGRCSSALSAYSVSTILSQCRGERAENQERFPSNKSQTGETRQTKEICPRKFVKEVEIFKGCEVAEDLTNLYYGGLGKHRCRKTSKSRRKKVKNEKRRKGEMRAADHDFVVDEGRVADSYAVEKSSSDPYGDFRTSMVEMIIEKQIFGAKDLEKLLDCFLSLNSSYYHRVIVEVFMEICDTLFAI